MQESVALGQVSSAGPAVGLSEEQTDRQLNSYLSGVTGPLEPQCLLCHWLFCAVPHTAGDGGAELEAEGRWMREARGYFHPVFPPCVQRGVRTVPFQKAASCCIS